MAAEIEWNVFPFDVKIAFLHGKFKEDVYVEKLKGFELNEVSKKVYMLRKAFYCLIQATRTCSSRIKCYFMRHSSIVVDGFSRAIGLGLASYEKIGD